MTTEEPLIPAEIGLPFSNGATEWIKSRVAGQKLAEHASLPSLPLLQQARTHAVRNPYKVAIVDKTKNESFTYSQLLTDVSALTCVIRKALPSAASTAEEPRVSFLVPPGYDYVMVQWAIWAAGAVCVPMCTTHPVKELLYTISDSDPSLIILHSTYFKLKGSFQSQGVRVPILNLDPAYSRSPCQHLPRFTQSFPLSRRALMIYTSGTTSRPKGCVTTHENVTVQSQSLVEAWKYSSSDHLIHVLPLHHVHGIINGLTATLYAGGTVEMYPKFDPKIVWDRWSERSSTMFMAVPTVYSRLIDYFDNSIRATDAEPAARAGANALRLLISGSAALPLPIKRKFKEIAGQDLLERYGMTEIGMGLSCGLEPGTRIDGSVGWPLPGVQVRLVEPDSDRVLDGVDEEGMIEIKGGNVFREYWRMPDVTVKQFSPDGWFQTGDIAKRDASGAYFIQGRASVDVIKSGGYKISALEVEQKLLGLTMISEAVVIGVDDEEWGQRVVAIIKQKPNTPVLELKQMRTALKEEMAPYKIPSILKVVDLIERNAMGKVNKKDILRKYFQRN